MQLIKIYVRELFQKDRLFIINCQNRVDIFLQQMAPVENHHYQRAFYCLENGCFLDSTKTFQENKIVPFDHLILI
ncbi:MAG: hypothetical protein Q4C49_04885 [Bacillota bacterium]|nr:hypothetical protein [Bacillota bacterium]